MLTSKFSAAIAAAAYMPVHFASRHSSGVQRAPSNPDHTHSAITWEMIYDPQISTGTHHTLLPLDLHRWVDHTFWEQRDAFGGSPCGLRRWIA